MKKIIMAFGTVLLIFAVFFAVFFYSGKMTGRGKMQDTAVSSNNVEEVKPDIGEAKETEQEQEQEQEVKVPEHREVKGLYLTGNSAGLESRFNHMVELVNTTELNALVIDVKDDFGQISYTSNVPLVKELGADSVPKIKDIHKVMDILNKNDIYPIARIVTFKDSTAALNKPDLAIKSKDGSVWKDNKDSAWLNPYNKDAWEYPISVAEEAADLGFKEIQFDYVRFPTDGKRSLIDYGQAGAEKTMASAITEFLSYARERLQKKGVVVSADIYGLVTTVNDDMGIGQHLEDAAMAVDVLCPMTYPSHYAYGTYGIKYPDLEPYKTVYTSLSTAQQRIDAIDSSAPKAKLRPWLQDFTAVWLSPKSAYKQYTASDVKAQIKAAKDSGINEWILWNAGNKYSEAALEKQ